MDVISFVDRRPARPVAILLAVLLAAGCSESGEPVVEEPVRPVKIFIVGSNRDSGTLEYPGEITANRDVELGFEVQGKIIELPVVDGMEVSEGDLLARLDPTDYEAARGAAQADLRAARSAYNRATNIFKEGAGSQAEVDATLRDYQVAQENLKKAQKALDDTVLKASFSGKVAQKIADNFQNIQAKEPVLVLQDISSLEMNVNIPERDFIRMRPGLTLEERNRLGEMAITVSSMPDREFRAWLKSFTTKADPVTRTYKATFAFANPDDVNVLPGMTAKVVLRPSAEKQQEGEPGGFMVPVAAIAGAADGQAYAWVIDPASMQVVRRPVTLGEMVGARVQVTSGLENDEQIAASGVAHLREGLKVRLLGDN